MAFKVAFKMLLLVIFWIQLSWGNLHMVESWSCWICTLPVTALDLRDKRKAETLLYSSNFLLWKHVSSSRYNLEFKWTTLQVSLDIPSKVSFDSKVNLTQAGTMVVLIVGKPEGSQQENKKALRLLRHTVICHTNISCQSCRICISWHGNYN